MLLEGRTIGLVEDDPLMGESLVQSLSLEGGKVEWWKTGSEALQGLRTRTPDLVICDIRLPDVMGDDLFRQIASSVDVPPFLFMTAFGDIDQAVKVMREGAGDYITKPFEIENFMARAAALMRRRKTNPAEAVLGISPAIREIENLLQRVADLNTPLLITGETGAGKEVCARFLHSASIRSKEPFIAVNCAAIPADLMERELFGYRGATGQSFHHGFAERTRAGILFLDEVSELQPGLQAKLLRLVEAREYNRLGGEQLIQFRGRVICSANRDPKRLISEQQLRADLFYRINAVTVEVPPLRQRLDDIPWLMERYLQQFRKVDERVPRGFSSLAFEAALEHTWPGNVRELRNRVERAVALTHTEWIMPSDLFPDLARVSPIDDVLFATLSQTRDSAEKRQIERALRQTSGQIIEAAKLLGISRTTLWEKMRRLGLSGEMS